MSRIYSQHRDNHTRLHHIISGIGGDAPRTVLDFGAADGFFSKAFANMGSRVTAVERSRKRCEQIGRHAGIEVLHSSRVPEGRWDLVLGLSVLHHCPDWLAVYEDLMQAGETVILEIPHPDEPEDVKGYEMRPYLWYRAHLSGREIYRSEGWANPGPRVGRIYRGEDRRMPTDAMVGRPKDGSPRHRGNSTRRHSQVPDREWMDSIGFVPKTGTLNVMLDCDGCHWSSDPIHIDSRAPRTGEIEGPEPFYPIEFCGIPAYVCKPPRGRTDPRHCEIVSRFPLREIARLENGDTVWLRDRAAILELDRR